LLESVSVPADYVCFLHPVPQQKLGRRAQDWPGLDAAASTRGGPAVVLSSLRRVWLPPARRRPGRHKAVGAVAELALDARSSGALAVVAIGGARTMDLETAGVASRMNGTSGCGALVRGSAVLPTRLRAKVVRPCSRRACGALTAEEDDDGENT
jgi:hypothetical protein